MIKENYLAIEQLCSHYEVEESFFIHMNEHGLIELITLEEIPCIPADQLMDIEKMIRLYHELHVNVEGIDVVFNLLKKILELQEELAVARNRLGLYEDEGRG